MAARILAATLYLRWLLAPGLPLPPRQFVRLPLAPAFASRMAAARRCGELLSLVAISPQCGSRGITAYALRCIELSWRRHCAAAAPRRRQPSLSWRTSAAAAGLRRRQRWRRNADACCVSSTAYALLWLFIASRITPAANTRKKATARNGGELRQNSGNKRRLRA